MKTVRNASALAAAAISIAASAAAAAPAPTRVVMTPLPASQPVSFEVFLPLRNTAAMTTLLHDQTNPGSAAYHKWLTPAQFGAQFGPTPAAMAQAQGAMIAQGLQIAATHTRSFTVAGTAGLVQAALKSTLLQAKFSNGSARVVANTRPSLPAAAQAQGATIVKFSGRASVHSNARFSAIANPGDRYAPNGPYWFTDLKQAYDYPAYNAKAPSGAPLDGTGVSVAVLMTNDALDSDIKAVFDHERFTDLTGKPAPTIKRVLIDGGAPFNVNLSAEASLDVQQVLGGAPGATVTLVNIPDLSDDSVMDGYIYIVDSNAYDIVNSSFGGCELAYTPAYTGGQDDTYVLSLYDEMFEQGNLEGITFVASSGDEGGLACPDTNYFYGTGPSRFTPSVQFPSNSPHVTGVGGGNLETVTRTAPSLTATYLSENAFGDPDIAYDPYGAGANVAGGFWGATGGVSTYFARPDYQAFVDTGSTVARTTPDVGMQVGGCPDIALVPCGPGRSAVVIALGGKFYGVIGTSVSSPEFVGATALFVEEAGRVGDLNPYLYSVAARQTAGGLAAFHRAIPGFDGKYTAASPGGGYSYLVGVGTPKVRALFGMLDVAAAGDPQTPSNP